MSDEELEIWLRTHGNKILNFLLIMGGLALVLICAGVGDMMMGRE